MNQNVLGVFLFSFIVGTAVFVSIYFTPLPKLMPVYEAPVYQENHKPFGCNKNRVVNPTTPTGIATIKVRQAVLNQNTHKLYTDFLIKRDSPQTEVIQISLHFYITDGRSTKYMATETVTVKPEFDQNGVAQKNVLSSFLWLDDLKQSDNLYVIADSSINYNKSKNLEPVFNSALAVPLLKR